MAASKIKVTYVDGHEVTVKASPRAQLMTEERFGGMFSPKTAVRVSHYLAWASLSTSGQEPMGFEEWIDKIEEAEVIQQEIRLQPPGIAETVVVDIEQAKELIAAGWKQVEEDQATPDPTALGLLTDASSL